VLFFLIAALAVASAVGVVTRRRPVHSALLLVLHMFALALLFLLLRAQFLAAIQIIVYAGAVMVLFLFVIMLLGSQTESRRRVRLVGQNAAAIVFGLVFLAVMLWGAKLGAGSGIAAQAQGPTLRSGQAEAVAESLFTQYLYPFELTSILLLAAIVGAVVLAKRRD